MSPNPKPSRNRLRRVLRTARQEIDHGNRLKMDNRAQRLLMSHPTFLIASCVALYKSYDGETSTDLIAKETERLGKKTLYALPEKGMPLRFVEALNWTITSTGLPIPQGPEIILGDDDLIVVPGLGFDREGYRIGFGGGFYDRTLASSPANTIGLAYECQLVERCPRAAWDYPVQALATESTLYEFDSRETKD